MSPGTFFDLAQRAYRAAERRHGRHHRDFRVAGLRIRICFAGVDLVEPLTRALDHLRDSGDDAPDLQVMAWASAASGEMPPAPRWEADSIGAHGTLRALSDERHGAAWMHQAGGLQMLDRETSQAVYWLRDPACLPYWETAAPMRILLDDWFATRGLQLVHAAAVGDRRGAVLLAGPGGSGKSSTALGTLQSRLHYLADDYVLVDPARGAVCSLYSSGKVDRAGLVRLPFLAAGVSNSRELEREKALLFVHEAFPHKVLSGPLPVRALVMPTIDGGRETGLQPAGAAAALQALAPSTLLQSPYRSAARLRAMAGFVRQHPAYRLGLGADSAAVAGQLAGLLAPWETAERPLISVIIPAHNPGRFLGEALASVLGQDAAQVPGKLEVIIVDDGSDEDVAALAAPFREQLSIRLERQGQRGPAAARNRGIELARCDLLAFLDADDLWPAGTLSALLAGMEAVADADVVHGRLRNLLRETRAGREVTTFGPPRHSFNVGSMLFRRRVFVTAGRLDERLRFSEDVDLMVRIAQSGLRRRMIDDVCLYYRRHASSLTGTMPAGQRGRAHLQSWARILKASLDRRRESTTAPDTVSVIIVVKDGEGYLGQAIESVLRQTRPAQEIIVVDGHSQDATLAIAGGFPGVRSIQQPGTGLADARNAGIAAAGGDWIAFLDHDDIWPEHKLERQLEALRATPAADYALGLLEFFAAEGAALPPGFASRRLGQPQPGPTPGTLLARRRLFGEVGLFDGRYTIGCDLEWLQRVRRLGIVCAACPEVLLRKRLHAGNLSRRANANRREIFAILRASLDQDGPGSGQ